MTKKRIAVCLWLVLFGFGLVNAQEREITVRGRRVVIPDVTLVDQNGKKVRLYDDLIKEKTVAIGFFYTRCMYICTLHGKLFSSVQKELGSRLGRDVFLISITMDPGFDTSARIAKWGRSYGRRAGWTLLTGHVDEVGKVLQAMTGDTVGPRESHGTGVYAGNDETESWDLMFVTMGATEVARELKVLYQRARDEPVNARKRDQ
jgi:protein SCO1/2